MSSKSSRMSRCPHCDGLVAATKREHTCEVAGTTFVARVASYHCRRCRAVFLAGSALQSIDVEIACILALQARPGGETLRFLRKALGLRAVALASLLRVTAETLSRWEHGQRSVDANAWITVGSLVLERAGRSPATLDRLNRLASSAKMPRSMKIDVLGGRRYRIKITRGSAASEVPSGPAIRSTSALRTASAR